MIRILVVPERMIDLGRQMRNEATRLREMESRLGRAISSLDWEVRHQANVEERVHAARQQAQALAEQAEAMARFVSDRAAAFREADDWGCQRLGLVPVAPVAAELYGFAALPTHTIEGILRLGGLIRGCVGLVASRVPGALAQLLGHVEWLSTIPVAALAMMQRVDANGVIHVFGPYWLKELSGVSEHLTRIRPENWGRHLLGQELRLSFSPLANLQTAVGLIPVLMEDFRKHSGQGTGALASAIIIDASISVLTSKVCQVGGAALGSGLTPVLGPLGPVIGYTIGGVVGSYVSEWIRHSEVHDRVATYAADTLGWAATGMERLVSQAVANVFATGS